MGNENGSDLENLLRARFERVLSIVEESAERVGRDPSEVMLLPVTKTVPTEVLRVAYALGYRDFAENRVQELRRKSEELADLSPAWHLIGHLQTNKAGQAARFASSVQSVDSLRIAEALSRAVSVPANVPTAETTRVTTAEAEYHQNRPGLRVQTGDQNPGHFVPSSEKRDPSPAKLPAPATRDASSISSSPRWTKLPAPAGRGMEVLLEVNTSGEEAKYGLTPTEVPEILDIAAGLPGLTVRGFMTMAPLTEDESVIRRTFADLRELREHLAPQHEGDGVELTELSMGMSGDYQIAIEEGATIIRVGSALFGPRE